LSRNLTEDIVADQKYKEKAGPSDATDILKLTIDIGRKFKS